MKMIKDVYFQPNATDPVLDEKEVLDIVQQYIPNAKIVNGIDETGGEARTYAVDDSIILKVQRPHRLRTSTSLEKEAFFLKQLDKYEDIHVPYVFGYGKKASIEYTCMTKIQGIAAKYANLTQYQREEMLFELGKTLYKIHNINKEPFIDNGLFPNDKDCEGLKDRLNHQFNNALKKLIEHVAPKELEYAQQLANEELNKLSELDLLVPIHSNPALTHTFVTSENKFSGLIDFGDALISHPILDIRRWGLTDRKLLLNGYFSTEKVSTNFNLIWNISYVLDNIVDILNSQKKISWVKDVNELLPNN